MDGHVVGSVYSTLYILLTSRQGAIYGGQGYSSGRMGVTPRNKDTWFLGSYGSRARRQAGDSGGPHGYMQIIVSDDKDTAQTLTASSGFSIS